MSEVKHAEVKRFAYTEQDDRNLARRPVTPNTASRSARELCRFHCEPLHRHLADKQARCIQDSVAVVLSPRSSIGKPWEASKQHRFNDTLNQSMDGKERLVGSIKSMSMGRSRRTSPTPHMSTHSSGRVALHETSSKAAQSRLVWDSTPANMRSPCGSPRSPCGSPRSSLGRKPCEKEFVQAEPRLAFQWKNGPSGGHPTQTSPRQTTISQRSPRTQHPPKVKAPVVDKLSTNDVWSLLAAENIVDRTGKKVDSAEDPGSGTTTGESTLRKTSSSMTSLFSPPETPKYNPQRSVDAKLWRRSSMYELLSHRGDHAQQVTGRSSPRSDWQLDTLMPKRGRSPEAWKPSLEAQDRYGMDALLAHKLDPETYPRPAVREGQGTFLRWMSN